MIVMEAFTSGQKRNGLEVRRGVVEVLLTKNVTEPIDRRRQDENVTDPVQHTCQKTPTLATQA